MAIRVRVAAKLAENLAGRDQFAEGLRRRRTGPGSRFSSMSLRRRTPRRPGRTRSPAIRQTQRCRVSRLRRASSRSSSADRASGALCSTVVATYSSAYPFAHRRWTGAGRRPTSGHLFSGQGAAPPRTVAGGSPPRGSSELSGCRSFIRSQIARSASIHSSVEGDRVDEPVVLPGHELAGYSRCPRLSSTEKCWGYFAMISAYLLLTRPRCPSATARGRPGAASGWRRTTPRWRRSCCRSRVSSSLSSPARTRCRAGTAACPSYMISSSPVRSCGTAASGMIAAASQSPRSRLAGSRSGR